MSERVPNELPDIGSTSQRLRQNPKFDPLAAGVGPEEYFVWTRFDGATTLKDLILMTGFATPRAVEIVRKLRALGAILLPGESPEAVAAAVDPAMTEDVEIPVPERERILAMHRLIRGGDPVAILGVPDAGDKKAIKRAYFSLSKEFHPDRFYRKRTGSFGVRLTEVFEAIAAAYAALSGEGPRRPSSSGIASSPSSSSSATQNPTDHAADLFERACQAEVSGDLPGALRLFAQALRIEAPARYLRRAARCALAAAEPRIALEYARKAANLESNDPSTARVLAQAFKATGRLADAEEVLVLALMIKTENDQLAHELRADLAEIRRLANR
jgi:hypothetical protein